MWARVLEAVNQSVPRRLWQFCLLSVEVWQFVLRTGDELHFSGAFFWFHSKGISKTPALIWNLHGTTYEEWRNPFWESVTSLNCDAYKVQRPRTSETSLMWMRSVQSSDTTNFRDPSYWNNALCPSTELWWMTGHATSSVARVLILRKSQGPFYFHLGFDNPWDSPNRSIHSNHKLKVGNRGP